MAYHPPELLLVGAAQNLVLGINKDLLGLNYDFADNGYSDADGDRDSASW